MGFKQGENMAFYSGFNQQSMPQNTVANNGLYQQQQTLQDPNSGFFPTNPFYQTDQYGQQQVPQGYYGQSQQSFFDQPQQNFYSGTEGIQAQPIGYKNQMFSNYDDQNPFQRQMAYGSLNLPTQQQPYQQQQQSQQQQPYQQLQPYQQQRFNPQNFQQQNNQQRFFSQSTQGNLGNDTPPNMPKDMGLPVVNPLTGRNQYGYVGEYLPFPINIPNNLRGAPLNQQGYGPRNPATFSEDYLRTMANVRGQSTNAPQSSANVNPTTMQQGFGPQGPATFGEDYLKTMANVRGQSTPMGVNLPQAIDQMQQQQAQQRQNPNQGSRRRRMGGF